MKNDALLERFLRYVKIDTQSKEGSETYPSTAKQWDLLRLLERELKELGLADVRLDRHGYVMASVPSNLPKDDPAYGKVPPIGLLAHVDTSEAAPGGPVKPQVFTYEGGDIVLPADKSIVIKASENPGLKDCVGTTVITTDGTTLLGADDKAGVAIIMSAVERWLKDPKRLHGDVKIAFTPDEEVGAGTEHFDLKAFGAEAAYTLDGDAVGELNKETFSANGATLTVEGRDIHPGMAKDVMVNSMRVACDFVSRMPRHMRPETTQDYEPFIHPYAMECTIVKTTVKFILRDFKTPGLAEQERILRKILAEVQPLYPQAKMTLEFREQYRNMDEGLKKDPRVVDALWEAVGRAGLKPYWKPIRGGTDGSRLTAMGLPTPNVFTGGANYHSRSEWASLDGMHKALETTLHLMEVWVEKSRTGSPKKAKAGAKK
ncbi:MAG: peptidase T [Elusimicrobiota bacterium]|jgi:tripeptide aminopeptidase